MAKLHICFIVLVTLLITLGCNKSQLANGKTTEVSKSIVYPKEWLSFITLPESCQPLKIKDHRPDESGNYYEVYSSKSGTNVIVWLGFSSELTIQDIQKHLDKQVEENIGPHLSIVSEIYGEKVLNIERKGDGSFLLQVNYVMSRMSEASQKYYVIRISYDKSFFQP